MIRHLPGVSTCATLVRAFSLQQTDRIIPKAQLRSWLAAQAVDDLWIPWDFSTIQCEHGGIDPTKGGDCMLVSEQAFEKIHIDPSTYLPDLEVCSVCVEAEYERLKSSENLAGAVRCSHSP